MSSWKWLGEITANLNPSLTVGCIFENLFARRLPERAGRKKQ
jgi:hypothetical protein